MATKKKVVANKSLKSKVPFGSNLVWASLLVLLGVGILFLVEETGSMGGASLKEPLTVSKYTTPEEDVDKEIKLLQENDKKVLGVQSEGPALDSKSFGL